MEETFQIRQVTSAGVGSHLDTTGKVFEFAQRSAVVWDKGLMSNTSNLSPMDKSIRQVLRWIRWSFFKIHSHVTNMLIHYIINANIITM